MVTLEPPAAAPARAVAATRAIAPMVDLTVQKMRELWMNVRSRAEAEKPSLRAGLSRASIDGLEGDVLLLRVPDSPNAEMLKANVAAIRKAIEGVTGRALQIRVTVANVRAPEAEGQADEDPGDLHKYFVEKLR